MKRVAGFLRGLPKRQRVVFGFVAAGVSALALFNRRRGSAGAGTAAPSSPSLSSPSGVTTFTPGGVDPAGFGAFSTGFVDSIASLDSRLEMVEGARATAQALSPEDTDQMTGSTAAGRILNNAAAVLGVAPEFSDGMQRAQTPPIHIDPFPGDRPPSPRRRGTPAVTAGRRATARKAAVTRTPVRTLPPVSPLSTVTPERRRGPTVRRVVSPWAAIR